MSWRYPSGKNYWWAVSLHLTSCRISSHFITHTLYFMLSILNRDCICDKWLLHCHFLAWVAWTFLFSSDVRGKPSLAGWSLMERLESRRVNLHFVCAMSHACAQHFWCDEIKSKSLFLLLSEIQIGSFTVILNLFSLFLTTFIFFYFSHHPYFPEPLNH